MSHHRISVAYCFTSLLMLFLPSNAKASQWQLSLPAQQSDQIDSINLILTPDESRLGTASMPDQSPLAIAEADSPLTSSTSAESHPLYPQAQQKTLSNGQTQYLHTDLPGSVVLETDSNGNTIKTITYRPVGESGHN